MEQLGLISCASRFLSPAEPTYRLSVITVLIQQQGPIGDFWSGELKYSSGEFNTFAYSLPRLSIEGEINSLETIQPTSCCQQYHIRPMVCHLFLLKKKFLNKHSVTHWLYSFLCY